MNDGPRRRPIPGTVPGATDHTYREWVADALADLESEQRFLESLPVRRRALADLDDIWPRIESEFDAGAEDREWRGENR